jgi:hypothetical protein
MNDKTHCDICGNEVGKSRHPVGDRLFCDTCCPDCQPPFVRQGETLRIRRLVLVLTILVALFLLGCCLDAVPHAVAVLP